MSTNITSCPAADAMWCVHEAHEALWRILKEAKSLDEARDLAGLAVDNLTTMMHPVKLRRAAA